MKTQNTDKTASARPENVRKVKLICMSFDGDYQTERPEFESAQEAWEYDNDIGSKWYFYPFRFVVTASGKTIKDAPEPLDWLNGMHVKQVAAMFKAFAAKPEAQNMDAENFAFAVGSQDNP